MAKFIFVTGGVVSGLGKGITAASLGRLLKCRGLKVASQKLDPYVNVDPGTMSPLQHGEVFVTDDGAETDLDLGHYERFTDENLNKYSNLTTGKVYWNVLNKERQGAYLGQTVQIIPHITNEIKRRFYRGEDKIAIIGKNELAVTMLFKILMGEEEPDSGTVKWGASTTQAYFPKDHNSFFENCDYDLMDWMRQFSQDTSETFLRGFLGKMLFSGDEVFKPVNVLSGGEKVRCMISKMMLSGANFLVLDQPTNHLDLESIAALNNGLEAFKYNIIFSSHDHQLTQTVANRIIEITDDGIIDRMCSFDEYMNLTGGTIPER